MIEMVFNDAEYEELKRLVRREFEQQQALKAIMTPSPTIEKLQERFSRDSQSEVPLSEGAEEAP